MTYTFHQLQVFLEVVRQESITKASEELHITQPAVSIQLRNFQDQFEIPLTEIIGKRLFVTDFGRRIAAIAENVLREADAIKYETSAFKDLLAGKLRISSASTGKYVMPYFLGGFLKKHPGIDLVLDVTNKTRVVSSLRNNEIDFALVSVLPENLQIHEEKLLKNQLFLVGSTNQFEEEAPLIFREEGSATRSAMDQYFGKGKKRKGIELTSNEAVKQAVIAGLGYSIIPLIGIRNELNRKDLYIIPSDGLPITTTWRLVWLADKKLSPIALAYLDYLRKEKATIIQEQFQWYRNFDQNGESEQE